MKRLALAMIVLVSPAFAEEEPLPFCDAYPMQCWGDEWEPDPDPATLPEEYQPIAYDPDAPSAFGEGPPRLVDEHMQPLPPSVMEPEAPRAMSFEEYCAGQPGACSSSAV